MTWVKMDDQFPEDPETVAVGEDAAWLHFLAIAYCSRNLTDGRLPKSMVKRLTSKPNLQRLVAALLEKGWWSLEGDEYVIRNYLKHQRSKAQVEAEREGSRRRAEKSRRKSQNSNGVTSAAGAGGVREPETDTDTEPDSDKALRDVPKSQTALVHRLNDACRNPNLAAAESVVAQLQEHVDSKLIDECVGWAMERDLEQRPRSPAFFMTVVRDWAKQRGVRIPEAVTA